MNKIKWFALAAFAVAGFLDWATWALVPTWRQAFDGSMVARALIGLPLVLLATKMSLVVGTALLFPAAQYIGKRDPHLCHISTILCYAIVSTWAFGAVLWTYGAWTNVVYGWGL